MIDWTETLKLVGLIVATGLSIASILSSLSSRKAVSKKIKNEAADSISDAAKKIAESYKNMLEDIEISIKECNDDVKSLKLRVAALEKENETLKKGVQVLCSQIVNFGQDPKFKWDDDI